MIKPVFQIGEEFIEDFLNQYGNYPVSELNEIKIDDGLINEIYEINKYLPISPQNRDEEEYLSALSQATKTSLKNKIYQFACVQYHMQFMTAVYYVLWKLWIIRHDEMDSALYYLLKGKYKDLFKEDNIKNGDLYFGSFAAINESEVFLLFRTVGLTDDILDDLKDRVKSRNSFTHANGNLMIKSDKLFVEQIVSYNNVINKTVSLIKETLVSFYKSIITEKDFYDPEIRAYFDPDEQIREAFIRKYAISMAELNWLRKIKTSEFKLCLGYDHIKDLHIALMHYYDLLSGKISHPFEDQYILYKYTNKASEFVEIELNISEYECVKDGGEFPVYECPDCGAEHLVYDAEHNKFHCFACDENHAGEEFDFCSECGRVMYSNECGICDDCFEYKMGKD